MSKSGNETVNKFFAAMQTGASAEEEMMALFHDDAVYIEPFTGKVRTHNGKIEIRTCMRDGWKYPQPDMRIEIDQLIVEGHEVFAQWTCYSPGLPGGFGKGENRFTLKDGLISRLETKILGPDQSR